MGTAGLDLVNRILNELKSKNVKVGDFYKAVNIKAYNMSNWKVQDSMPAADTAIKIAKYLNVSVEWLILGKEAGLTRGERDILEAYNQLSDEGKKAAMGMMRGLITTYPQVQAGESTGTGD